METVEPQGVTTVKDGKVGSNAKPDEKLDEKKKEMYKNRESMKKEMTAIIGDSFVIRTIGTMNEKKEMSMIYQETFKKVDGDTKEKDKVAIEIVINKKLEAEMYTTTSIRDANHLPQGCILFEREKEQDYMKKLKELLLKKDMKTKHIDITKEYIIVVIFDESIPPRLQKKILEYIESDVGLLWMTMAISNKGTIWLYYVYCKGKL